MVVGAIVVSLAFVGASAWAATSYPNDYYLVNGGQWALTGAPASINAPAAWCIGIGQGIVVADIDSGAEFDHQDLAGKLIAGAAFVNTSADTVGRMSGSGQAAVTDDNGHGTLTTGIIVANTNNRYGIAAVAPGAKALIVKVSNSSGIANGSDLAAGMRWAVDNGAKVLNVSMAPAQLDVTTGVSDVASAADYAGQHDVAVAFAAGNSSSGFNSYQLLENKPTVLVVGALARDGSVPSYSNGGASIYAPGGDAYVSSDGSEQLFHNVVSTYWGGTAAYATAAGTSLSTPMVAGVFALLMAKGSSAAGAKQQILNTARIGSVPELDAALAMGTSSNATCGSPASSSVPVPPPTLKRAPPENPAPRRHSLPATMPPTITSRVSAAPSSTPAVVAIAPTPSTTPTKSSGPATPSPTSSRALRVLAVAALLVAGAVVGFGRPRPP